MTEDEAKPPSWKPRPRRDNPARYPGDDTYSSLPPGAGPRLMEETFFYYIGPGADATARTLVYQIDGQDLPKDEQFADWVTDARKGGSGAFSRDFDSFGWHKPCHLVFFVDMPGWILLDETTVSGQPSNRALYFAEIPAGSTKPESYGNYTFFNAGTRLIDIEGEQKQLLTVQNLHFKAPTNGKDKYKPRVVGEPSDPYKFDIYMGMKIENSATEMLYFVVDPGGRNTGPP